MLALAGAAVIAAVLVIALTGSSKKHPARTANPAHATVVQLAAGYLGVPPSEVRARLRHGATLAQLAATAKHGSRAGLIEALYAARAAQVRSRHLPAGKERAELRALRSSLAAQVDHARRHARVTTAAARYLGLSEAQLAARLAAGRTLASVAASTPGRSRAGLLDALVAARRKAIETAVADKATTAAAARRAIVRVRRQIERQIDRAG